MSIEAPEITTTPARLGLNLDKSTWTRVRFGDVVRNANGKVKDPETEGVDRIIAMEHLDPGEITVQRWGSLGDGTTFTRHVKPGQTLFGKRRAYQRKAAFAEFEAVCSGDILTFEAVEGRMLPEFLPFLVQSNGFYDHALGTSAGSLSPRTNWRDLKDYEFSLPPLDEQKRLADLLWSLERHRQSLGTTEEALDGALNCLRHRAFTNDRATVPASEAFEIVMGRQRSPKFAVGSHLVPYLRSANVTKHGINIDDVKQMNFTPEEQCKYSLRPGDVLVSEASASAKAVGQPAVWQGEIPGTVCMQNTLLRFRARQGVSDPAFVAEWCHWTHSSGAFASVASGTNIHHIGVQGASMMRVALPVLAEQKEIARKAGEIRAVQEGLRDESYDLSALRAALLAEIFEEAN